MKLELKHLAPYLPYGLKLVCNQDIAGVLYRPINLTERFYSMPTAILTNFKPILRPLSDLFNVINHNNKEFKPLDFIKDQCEEEYFTDTDFESYIKERKGNTDYLIHAMDYLPYGLTNKFIEWHFDVFKLIPKGLAIDRNTL